ncbi:MAG: acetyl/propionyl/methylcrotonyl-CoA carboxylase subunit alpha [Alphaproteobacteria bacterium]
MRKFVDRLLVANRGEIACRVLRAAKSLGMPTVAVFSEADADAPHVGMADAAVAIGPPRAVDSYLDAEKLIAAARTQGATLVHPGYGFLSENARFAEMCGAAGIGFVGPTPAQIRAMGDKERARATAAAAGVPIVPGSGPLPAAEEEIVEAGRRVGYPLLVKAAAGGGGIGMRQAASAAELLAAVASTRQLAGKAFGSDIVYLERYVARARHIEVQVFGFGDGEAVHLFERECSLQRRHQKVVEEAPAPNLPAGVRRDMTEAALSLARALRYVGAGTVEFLYDEAAGQFHFLEMNTRIQVEHPVTEEVTGVDLVAAQIRQARGEDLRALLDQARLRVKGHAIEARVYAEKPAKNFQPSPGLITRLRLPTGEAIRVESGYREGQRVTPFYDPMLMKIVAHGATRAEAAGRLDAALAELEIEGIETNAAFLQRLLQHPDSRAGRVHTKFVEENLADLIA